MLLKVSVQRDGPRRDLGEVLRTDTLPLDALQLHRVEEQTEPRDGLQRSPPDATKQLSAPTSRPPSPLTSPADRPPGATPNPERTVMLTDEAEAAAVWADARFSRV